jgi:hypothetical protein
MTKKLSSGDCRRAGEERADAVGDPRRLGAAAGDRARDRGVERVAAGGVLDAEDPPHGLGDWREARPSGRVAAGGEHRGAVPEPEGELRQQARLAETRRAEDHGEPRARRGDGRFVDRQQPPQLVLASDERDRRDARGPVEGHDPVRRHRLGPALEREGPEGSQGHEAPHETLRRLADQDVAVPGLLLEARRHVHGIADDLGLVRRDDLARVHRDPQPDRTHDAALLGGELAEGALHGDRGAHGAQRVVLGHPGGAEHGLHPVPEKLGHGAALGLHRGPHGPVVAVHEGAGGLRVEALVQSGRAHQVGEDDADDLARPGGLLGAVSEGDPAGIAEPRAGLALGAAGRAARRERPAAAAAESGAGPVRSPAATAVHGASPPPGQGIASAEGARSEPKASVGRVAPSRPGAGTR